MTREDKCKVAISKGFTYNEDNGDIITPTGVIASKVSVNGYIVLIVRYNGKAYYLYGHQFAWYFKHSKVVLLIDHINKIKTDNRISNLRSTTKQVNALNVKNHGAFLDKRTGRYESGIVINGKRKYLGKFNTKEEAEKKYKEYKEHKIKQLCK